MGNFHRGAQRLGKGQDVWLANHIGGYRWVILFVTTLTQATIALISQGIGTLAPFLITELGLTKTQVGFAGGAVNVGMTLTALLAGRAVDTWGEKRVLVVGGLATGEAVLLASLSNTFLVLIVLLMFTGLWAATSTPAGSKAIMTWFPFSQRGLALGIRQTGVPLGGMVAALLIPPIAISFGWKIAMGVMGLGPILGAALCQVAYKDHPMEVKVGKTVKSGKWTELLRNKEIWLVSLTAITYVAAQFTIVTYLVLYLHDKTSFSVALASLFLALVQFGGMAGRIFWGYVSDTFFQGARKPVLAIIGIMAIAMALAMLALTPQTPMWIIGLATWLFGFSAIGWNGIYITLLSEVAGRDQAGTAVGLGLTLLQLGVLIFPPLFGFFVDFSGSYQTSWLGLSILVAVGVGILGFVKERRVP
ncbi:MAG: MFS transporter [Desulfitobacteriaceae bacterium]|nr:MFS transporter [Desulfitobacteriaceae bacterium]MDI6878812.1 MFS transporter [Desulfitobacteriaceae bacterium]MDI6914222.1 MFS transporter [Desulfitobacteriaceae bacterium]